MTDGRLINWINSQLSKGLFPDQIKQNLLARGWSDYDIDEAIKAANQPKVVNPKVN